MNEITLRGLKKTIASAKTSLMRQAREGFREDFGHKEIRDIEDQAFQIIHDGMRCMPERNETASVITDFVDWVESYQGGMQ